MSASSNYCSVQPLTSASPQPAWWKSATCDHNWGVGQSWHTTLRRKWALALQMLQKLALPLSIVTAEGVDAEVAPLAVAAVRNAEGRVHSVSTARVRVAVHALLQALGRQEAQVTLTRPVGRPLLGWFLPSRCKEGDSRRRARSPPASPGSCKKTPEA